MCCLKLRDVENIVRKQADEDGWITAYKVVHVRRDDPDNPDNFHLSYEPIYGDAIPFKKGKNSIPAEQMKKSWYNPNNPHGFHVWLKYEEAKTDNFTHLGGCVILVKANMKDFIRAGSSTIHQQKGKEPCEQQAVFTSITIPNLEPHLG